MKKRQAPSATTPPPDVQQWLDSLSAPDRLELLRTWQWSALGEDESPDSAATQTAWARLQPSVHRPHTPRLAADRSAQTPRFSSARKMVIWSVLGVISTATLFYLWTVFSTQEQAAITVLPQTHFMLLLHDDGDIPTTPSEKASRVAEYTAWADELRAAGHLIGGDELADEGHLLQGAQDPTLQPWALSARTIGGYFIIAAQDDAEALTLASACPQLRHGGTVELRPIVQR